MKKEPKNFAKVWIRILDRWMPGAYINGHFFRKGGVIVTPHEWRYRIQLCTNQNQKNPSTRQATNSQTVSAMNANVIPLSLHPEYAPVARPISLIYSL